LGPDDILTNMLKKIYSIHPPKHGEKSHTIFGHRIIEKDKALYVCPKDFSENEINPTNFDKLKTELGLDSILILDRVKNIGDERCIRDHVNRSGYNFLTGKTPYKNLPTFPDISHIYNAIPNMDGIKVHTIGPIRFSKINSKGILYSESVGIVSPVWYYVGVKVFARNYKTKA